MSERIPRLQLEAMPAALAGALRPRVERLGYLGEFFQCAANAPEVLLEFQRFTEVLKEALPARVTELVALTVAARWSNDYERHQHERLCRRLGYDDAWIRAVTSLQAGAAALDETDRAVQALVLRAIERQGHDVAAELNAVIDALGAPAAMAVLMSIGRYLTHSLVVNALDLAPPVASLFDKV